MMTFTVEQEKEVIRTLVEFGQTKDPRGAAFHAVDRAMDWTTPDTMACVEGLQNRKLLHLEPVVAHGDDYQGFYLWKEGWV
jgi:hypothetical protein